MHLTSSRQEKTSPVQIRSLTDIWFSKRCELAMIVEANIPLLCVSV